MSYFPIVGLYIFLVTPPLLPLFPPRAQFSLSWYTCPPSPTPQPLQLLQSYFDFLFLSQSVCSTISLSLFITPFPTLSPSLFVYLHSLVWSICFTVFHRFVSPFLRSVECLPLSIFHCPSFVDHLPLSVFHAPTFVFLVSHITCSVFHLSFIICRSLSICVTLSVFHYLYLIFSLSSPSFMLRLPLSFFVLCIVFFIFILCFLPCLSLSLFHYLSFILCLLFSVFYSLSLFSVFMLCLLFSVFYSLSYILCLLFSIFYSLSYNKRQIM